MQNMNNKVPGHAGRLAQQRSLHLKMLAFAECCGRRQSTNGGLFLGGNPMGSIAWQQSPCLRMSRRCYEVKLDQCMFRLRAPDAQESIKEPTKMLTTSHSAARNLSIRCGGSHSHRTIGGRVSCSKNGRQVRQTLSEFCGGYTEEMAAAMVLGFEEDLTPVSHLANVVSRKRALDELGEEAARCVARRVGYQEPASPSTDKKKRRRDFAEERREMTQRAKIPKPTTRSMTRGLASQQGAAQQDDDREEIPQHFEEAMGHWFHDMEENMLYLEPEQQAHHQERDPDETPVPNQQNNNSYHQETEEGLLTHKAIITKRWTLEKFLCSCITPTTFLLYGMNMNNFQDQIFPVATISNNVPKTMIIIKNRTRPLSSPLSQDGLVRTSR